MDDITLRDFEITYAIEKDLQVTQFAVGNDLADRLNNTLQLKDYCAGITSLFVVFQCFAPENEHVQPKAYQRFRPKTKVIELYLLLDYHKARQAGSTTMLRLLAESYISGIQQVLQRKDFKKPEFIQAVNTIFTPYIA